MEKSVETIGRYQLTEELGRGSMGIVHRAHDPVMGRDVAIKTILMPHGLGAERTAEYQERFLREARAAGRLSHPGIVTIYDFDRHDDGLPFIAMEYVEGPTLHELICHEGALKPSWAIEVTTELADALQTAHELDIVHRDLKPANVLVRASDGAAKITDFGVARMSRSDLTQVGVTYGSPAYIAPECLRGQRADGRSDLFALSVMLYEMLCGGRPFEGDDFASVCHAICNEPPRPISQLASDLTPAFNTFFARAFAKDPERRFQTGAELAAGLADLAQEQIRYAEGGSALQPLSDTPEPARLAPERLDAAARRLAAMGRTGELIVSGAQRDAGATQVLTFPVAPQTDRDTPTGAIDTALDSAIPGGRPAEGLETDQPHGPSQEAPPLAGAAMVMIGEVRELLIYFVRRQPALAGGIALGIALLMLVAIAGRSGQAPEPVSSGGVVDPAAAPIGAAIDGFVPTVEPLFVSLTDEPPFGLRSSVSIFDGVLIVPNGDDADTLQPTEAIGDVAADTPKPTTTRRSSVKPPRSRASTTPPSSGTTPASRPIQTKTGVDSGNSASGDVAPDEIVATGSGPAAAAPTLSAATVEPSTTPISVPLTIELRSGVKDGSLVVELDGAAIYSAELAAEARGFRRAMKKAIGRDEDEFSDTVHVPVGPHSIVVRLINNAKGAEYTTTLDTTIEADGPHRLRITAGRLMGRRLSATLVD